MEQEIQQNVNIAVTSNKQSMYISWKAILLIIISVIVVLAIILFALIMLMPNPELAAAFYGIVVFKAFEMLLPIFGIVLIVGSFITKPRGFTRTIFVDMLLVVPFIKVLITGFLLPYASMLGAAVTPLIAIFSVPAVIVICLAIYLNHKKFQKSENEITTLK